MNTPAHVAASLLVWRKEKGTMAASAVVLGALLPDLPMFGFYGYQKSWWAAANGKYGPGFTSKTIGSCSSTS